MTASSRVLVVDDDRGIADLLCAVLRSSGYDVVTAETAVDALSAVREGEFDAILLDRWLPEADGLDIVVALRAASPTAALIMLSAVDDVAARVEGLRRGADDFLTKPFHVSEVLARIEAVKRRGGAAESDILRYRGLVVDLAAHRVTRDGDLIVLTPTELRLLVVLLEHAERVLSRAQILERVWHYDFGGGADVVEKAISNLRKKVDGGREPLVQTVRGFGYCLRSAGR